MIVKTQIAKKRKKWRPPHLLELWPFDHAHFSRSPTCDRRKKIVNNCSKFINTWTQMHVSSKTRGFGAKSFEKRSTPAKVTSH